MQGIDYHGNPVDAGSIDWHRYSGRSFPWLIRQRPGPQNALGRIKFMFPNRYSVYLHDTPGKSLFAQPERAFSSGCIRIEHPYQLAELLQGNAGRDRAHLQQAIDSQQTRTINLQQPVTILLMYWTVSVDVPGPYGSAGTSTGATRPFSAAWTSRSGSAGRRSSVARRR